MRKSIVHCQVAKCRCTELWTIVLDADIRNAVRCEYLLQDVDNALRRQVVETFALDPSRVAIDYDEIYFGMQFEQVHRKSSPSTIRNREATNGAIDTGRSLARVT